MEHLIFLGRQSWKQLTFALLMNLVAGLSISAVMIIIDWGIREPDRWVEVFAALLVASLSQLLMQMLSTKLLLNVTLTALSRLRLQLCRRILASPQEDLQRIGKARLLAVLTHDANSLMQAYQAIIALLHNTVIIVVSLLYIGWISSSFAVAAVCLIACGMTLVQYLTAAPLRGMSQVRHLTDELYRHLRDLTEATRELQLNSKRADHFIHDLIAPVETSIKNQSVSVLSHFAALGGLGDALYFVGGGALLFLLPHLFDMGVDPKQITAVAIAFLFMSTSIQSILQLLPSLAAAKASLWKINQLTEELPQAVVAAHRDTKGTNSPFSLSATGVQYFYERMDEMPFTLGPIDFQIQGGEIVFLAGGNGSGKSTLVMVLLGLYQATAGQIEWNGALLTPDNLQEYREHFSAIFADFHLFEHLIEDNGDLVQQAKSHLAKLLLAKKVNIEGTRFSTVNLSTGQRKRLALVNAYLENRPCYFFDEWAADQDPEFRRFFYRELLPELKARGKAVVAITHDEAYFDCADRILKLDNGQITEIA